MQARASGDSATRSSAACKRRRAGSRTRRHRSRAACESDTRRLSTAQHRLARKRLAAALVCAPVPFWTQRANHRHATPQPATRIKSQVQVNGRNGKDVEDQISCGYAQDLPDRDICSIALSVRSKRQRAFAPAPACILPPAASLKISLPARRLVACTQSIRGAIMPAPTAMISLRRLLSITRLARSSIDCGIVNPIVSAVYCGAPASRSDFAAGLIRLSLDLQKLLTLFTSLEDGCTRDRTRRQYFQ